MAKDMTLLWGSGSPPCWRVMIALEEKGLQGYNHKLLSFEKGEHKSQEVLDMNPRGQLPSFKHGSFVLNESYGACMYLESQFKSQGNELIPRCAAEQAMMYQRMFEGLTLTQKMGTWPKAEVFSRCFAPQGVTCSSCIAYLFRFGLNEERYPKLTEYYNLLKDRPSIKTSWPPTWLDDPQAKDLLKDI
ncbi:Glutathione S-transferase A [Scophthalmus maximus]|uniref:Glutathione S-transferase A n=1 Tax=Scophthalmus maximus TaxID=52904 RepID=A0A2U9BLH5_SCOMX|nr:Glutathione S-transferase A [Scophthalmus maximus]